jgi:hypothetical protein
MEATMPHVMSRFVPYLVTLLFLIIASQLSAQTDTTTPSLKETINQLRLKARAFHPEHGEVRALKKLGGGATNPSLPLNRYLSIFVSDVDTTKAIKFSDVMDQLVRQSGDPQLTKQILFSQWWDTAGQGPGLGLGPHCDDGSAPTPPGGVANQTATSTFNGFPYRCPRLEAFEAKNDPFANEVDSNPNAYSAIAFSNRFDLLSPAVAAPSALGKVIFPDCGEYRIVFARNSGQTDPLNRNLIIFEARVANPKPTPESPADVAPIGCLPILDFWHSLSDPQMSAEDRGSKLRDFYLNGKLTATTSINPVVDIANYSFGTGQIRTNQFMLNSDPKPPAPPIDWTLREFKALQINGTLIITPDTVKANPGPDLFAVGTTDLRESALTQSIRSQMKSILGLTGSGLADDNSIGFSISGEGVNAFESDEKGLATDPAIGDIMVKFDPGNIVPLSRTDAFVTNIQSSLATALPATNLTSVNVVDRIRTQTCSGCHQFSDSSVDLIGLGGGAVWPNKRAGDLTGATDLTNHPPMPFTQESEILTNLREAISASANGKKGKRWAISTTVECLLDHREKLMDQALGLTGAVSNHCP